MLQQRVKVALPFPAEVFVAVTGLLQPSGSVYKGLIKPLIVGPVGIVVSKVLFTKSAGAVPGRFE